MFSTSRLFTSSRRFLGFLEPPAHIKYIRKINPRYISLDKLSNKKITRLESDIELDDCEFKGRLINRNPRNLEQLAFEQKPAGFWLDTHSLTTMNKLILVQNGRYLDTYLLHWSGKKLVQASTKESKLSKYYYNPSATQAAIILARIMARRCLQAGYICAGVDEYEFDNELPPKSAAFFEIVASNGLRLSEQPEISPRKVTDL